MSRLISTRFPRAPGEGQTFGDSKGGEVMCTEPLLIKGGVNTPTAKSLLFRWEF